MYSIVVYLVDREERRPSGFYYLVDNHNPKSNVLVNYLCNYWSVYHSGVANHGYNSWLLIEFLRNLFQYNLKIFDLRLWIPILVQVEYIQGRRYRKKVAGILVNERHHSISVTYFG